jgi:hypothetical protein
MVNKAFKIERIGVQAIRIPPLGAEAAKIWNVGLGG